MPKMKPTGLRRPSEPGSAAPRRFDLPEAKKPIPTIDVDAVPAASPAATTSSVTLEEASVALVQLHASYVSAPPAGAPAREIPSARGGGPPRQTPAYLSVEQDRSSQARLPSPARISPPPPVSPLLLADRKRLADSEYQLRPTMRRRLGSDPPAGDEDDEDDEDEDEDNIDGVFAESSAVVQLMVDAEGNIVVNTDTLKRAKAAPAMLDDREVIEEPEREYRNVFDVRRREVKWSKQDVADLWEYLAMTGLNYPFLAQWFGFEQDPNDSRRRIPRRTPAQVKTKVTSLSRKQAIKYDRVVFGDLRKPLDFELFKRVSGRHDL